MFRKQQNKPKTKSRAAGKRDIERMGKFNDNSDEMKTAETETQTQGETSVESETQTETHVPIETHVQTEPEIKGKPIRINPQEEERERADIQRDKTYIITSS